MIETLISRVFATRNLAQLAHWRTKSFAQHMALGSFYDDVIDKLDAIVEVHQGATSHLVGSVPSTSKTSDVISTLKEDCVWISQNRAKIADGVPAIENLLDDLCATYLTTIYKLEQLK